MAAEDIDTTARASHAVELIRHRHAIPLPATLTGRLVAARKRWTVASGDQAWAERIAATRGRPPGSTLETAAN